MGWQNIRNWLHLVAFHGGGAILLSAFVVLLTSDAEEGRFSRTFWELLTVGSVLFGTGFLAAPEADDEDGPPNAQQG